MTDTEIVIPPWVPDHIQRKARELCAKHGQSQIAAAVIERLATDPRMRGVWNEFDRLDRNSGEPFSKLAGEFASIDREDAIAGLFEFAVNIGRLTLMLPPADKPLHQYEATAERLRDEAKRLGRDTMANEAVAQLDAMAERLEAVTVAAHNPDKSIAVAIASWLKSVFGSHMYKITALITGVITGRDVTERKVRTWLSHPAK